MNNSNSNNPNHETVFQSIVAHLFGHKYYANIIGRRGTEITEISCNIFHTREEAERHRLEVNATLSFVFIETVTFRSRRVY